MAKKLSGEEERISENLEKAIIEQTDAAEKERVKTQSAGEAASARSGKQAKSKKKKKRSSAGRIISTLLIILALCVMAYSAYRLYDIFSGYAKANHEYEELADAFTAGQAGPKTLEELGAADWNSEPAIAAEETAPPPIEVDWTALKEINSDIVGWIHMEAQPTISYPICHDGSNEFYLHHTFRKEAVFAGAIFVEAKNQGDFSDRNTIIYGHNMKNQSMFGLLKYYKTEETYKKSPYFWILTPRGNYRYKIFAAMDTAMDSDVYTIFKSGGEDFLKWAQRMVSYSAIDTGVKVREDDYMVTLSTCTSNSSVRCVVLGRLVSTDRPPVDADQLFSELARSKEKALAQKAAETAREYAEKRRLETEAGAAEQTAEGATDEEKTEDTEG